jgi:hypothetical protein
MFYEYALEPAVLSSRDRVRFFLDAFGPWKGRLLAEYPRRWKRMVIQGLDCPPVEKLSIVERLRDLDDRVFSARANFDYDGTRSWLENTLTEHQREAFRAIIAAAPSTAPYELDGATVDERDPLWRVETGQLVAREPEAFVKALELLLKISSRVIIVDPYLISDTNDKTRAVCAFCDFVRGHASVEVHCSDSAVSYDHCMRTTERALQRALPLGVEVQVHCWKERRGGRRLHNRYLLTDVGGVKFGDSIEHGGTGQNDHLSILDDGSYKSLWNDYVGDSPAFDAAGPPRKFIGTRIPRR